MRITRLIILGVVAISIVGCDNCDQLKSDAKALRDKHSTCRVGDTCVIVDMYQSAGPNNCLLYFQCSHALNQKGLDEFSSDAQEIAEGYEGCGECTMADCSPISNENHEAYCDGETGQCKIRPLSPQRM